MNCLILKNSKGEKRLVPLDGVTNYVQAKDEVVDGVAKDCNIEDPVVVVAQPNITLVAELDREIGPGAGNWIKTLVAPVAKLLGKQQCGGCESRRVVANAYSRLKEKYGQIDALAKIKDLWQMSLTESPDVVMAKLKEYISE